MAKTSLVARAKQFQSEGIVHDRINSKEALICTYCGIDIKNSKSQIKQHTETAKHKSNRLLKSKHQTLSNMKVETEFGKDLCRVSDTCMCIRRYYIILTVRAEYKYQL